ncbi:hypothetical protein JBL43_08070 [Aureibaculum sp. A20]|uniref:Uncharacterized protein n=1 Tax=Aureibaculum flavum TaxID=2795986 RepID=A0ABS0WQD5_9FLAO|nr:hypothetical protein [Aureibaculum flavum]MBJ2174190.1 hypothetical protein [Aureibaculum flavum]
MTLYEYLLLEEQQQYNSIWDIGIYLDTVNEDNYKINIYAIDMFFVEVVYNAQSNKIIENRAFKEGHRLDKYSLNFKTKY